jgi:acyl carrier protein/NAD(P)-dependent dehydrogenase (short-subunit alcohol dehydrogenase family)
MAAVLAHVERELPPLAGIVHAAGVVADGLLLDQTRQSFETTFAPKVDGAWTLHRLTRDLLLDFFVLFSSASTLLGGAGLASYVAANEFLDALAAYRRRLGLPALSIDWGPWSNTGMAARVGRSREAEWRAAGIDPLRPDDALAAMGSLLAAPVSRVGIMDLDWSRLRRHPAAASLAGFLELLPVAGEALAPSAVRRQVEAAPPTRRRHLLLAHIRAEVEAVLGWPPGEHIRPTQGFFDLGMDSLQANELRNRLQASLGCTLPPTLTFRFPTTAELADHLARDAFGVSDPRQTLLGDRGVDEPSAGSDAVSTLSRELAELERLIGS